MARNRSYESVEAALSGAYGLDELDRLMSDVQPLLRLDEPARVTVNLSELSFLHPVTAVVLCVALHRLVALDLRVPDESRLLLPCDENVKNYLLRLDVIQAGAGIVIEEPFARREPIGFRECQRFTTETEATEVARELTGALDERCALDDQARLAINTCLAELCSNVPHHASTTLGGVAAAQGYPQRSRFEAAIADLGIGIRHSLIENPAYAHLVEDAEAIQAALELGVTSKPDDTGRTRHSGYGLAVTQHLLRRNGGRLVVRSGSGEVAVGARPAIGSRQVDFPGTLVVLEAWTNKPLDVRSVYQDLLGGLDD